MRPYLRLIDRLSNSLVRPTLRTVTMTAPTITRLVENFYRPDAENFEGDKLLARRIQTTEDMVALKWRKQRLAPEVVVMILDVPSVIANLYSSVIRAREGSMIHTMSHYDP
jgi:hypothetical protein